MFLRLGRPKIKRRIVVWFLAVVLGSSGIVLESTAQHDWTDQIAAFKPMVVNVETSSEVVFETESKGTSFRHRLHRRCSARNYRNQ